MARMMKKRAITKPMSPGFKLPQNMAKQAEPNGDAPKKASEYRTLQIAPLFVEAYRWRFPLTKSDAMRPLFRARSYPRINDWGASTQLQVCLQNLYNTRGAQYAKKRLLQMPLQRFSSGDAHSARDERGPPSTPTDTGTLASFGHLTAGRDTTV